MKGIGLATFYDQQEVCAWQQGRGVPRVFR